MNLKLFKSNPGNVPTATSYNEAGGKAYALAPQLALAQYTATGCLNGTFYASAETQLDAVLKMAAECDAEFVAKTAVFARQRGFMKDMPALLAAHLAQRDPVHGGFSNSVFELIASYADGTLPADYWVSVIQNAAL